MMEIIERLKVKGITLTPQRIAIVEFLGKSVAHPTVEDIHKAIKRKYPTMSMATVYSTLRLLKELGEIQELSIMKRGKACFDPNPKLHHHFLCRKCGKILDMDVDCPIIKKGWVSGCRVEEAQAYLYGVCSECLKKEQSAKE